MSAVGEFSHSMCILFGVLVGLGPVQAWNTKELHKFGNTVHQWTAGKLQDCGRLLAARQNWCEWGGMKRVRYETGRYETFCQTV
jgi:hypothetical protein